MNIKKIYDQIGGDYEEALGRLRKPERIEKYLNMFKEADYITPIKDAFEKGDAEAAFLAVHTLKGVCANLSLTQLLASSHELTEDLRPKAFTEKSKKLLNAVEADYEAVSGALKDV